MAKVANLTQHPASKEQKDVGVIDLEGDALAALKDALTFGELPTWKEVAERADTVARLAVEEDVGWAMIGGAPYLMASLEEALRERGIEPLYAFSVRESVEATLPDGSVEKKQVFRHLGFVSLTELD